MTGGLWAAASGIGFGLFQALNRRALGGIEDAYVSTFLQVLVGTVVLVVASMATEDLGQLAEATPWSLLAFALAGLLHFLVGWTFLNLSQKRIGAARTSPLLTTTPIFGLVVSAATLGQLPGPAALGGIAISVTGAYVLTRGDEHVSIQPRDAVFALGCSLMWALSPIFTIEGLEGLDSPLLGVTVGMMAATLAYALLLVAREAPVGLRQIAHGALAFKLAAGLLVALATWTRWLALDFTAVAVVLALNTLSVPVALIFSPLVAGRHVERVTRRIWLGSALVVGGSLVLILVA